MSFANRQVILHRIREVFSDVFGKDPADLGMHQVYDVAHNTAQLERHEVGGKDRELLVHRKGATKALPPCAAALPAVYRKTGQPVIIGAMYIFCSMAISYHTSASNCRIIVTASDPST